MPVFLWRSASIPTGLSFRWDKLYVIIPIANPDGYEWGTCHVVPYGNGYGDNAIHRGYMFFEPTAVAPDTVLDPEAAALRNYIRSLRSPGLDGVRRRITCVLDFQSDLCPDESRWNEVPPPGFPMYPPVYGMIGRGPLAQADAPAAFVESLTHGTYLGQYVRSPISDPKAWSVSDSAGCTEYEVPLFITFEFDGVALYSEQDKAPEWMVGEFSSPIHIPGGSSRPFYVHGYLDQVGQDTAGDAAYVFKQFGRDILKSTTQTLLNP